MGKKRINDEKIWRPDVLLVERGSIVKGTVETTEEHLTLPGDIPDSPINHMGKDLADRTLYLKEELEILRKYVDDVLACIQACSTGCKDACLDMCLDTCKDGCKGTCKETCSTTCKGSCVDTCSGTCKGGCGDVCSGGCGNNCSTNCSTQCSGTCTQTCGGNCVGACVTGCSGCKGSCEGGCLTGCYTTCTGSCNTTCSTSCATGCANNCAADCGGGCKNTCSKTCSTTTTGAQPTIGAGKVEVINDTLDGQYPAWHGAFSWRASDGNPRGMNIIDGLTTRSKWITFPWDGYGNRSGWWYIPDKCVVRSVVTGKLYIGRCLAASGPWGITAYGAPIFNCPSIAYVGGSTASVGYNLTAWEKSSNFGIGIHYGDYKFWRNN